MPPSFPHGEGVCGRRTRVRDARARADGRKPFAQSALGSGKVAGMAGTAAPAVKVRAGLVIMKL